MEIHKDVNKILEENKTLLAYLFGSSVTTNSFAANDVDIAIYLDEPGIINRFNIKCYLTSRLMKYFRKPVDIVVLNDIKNLFLGYDIISEGVVILNHDENLRVYFEAKLIHHFIDFKNSLILNNLYPHDNKTLSNRRKDW